MNIDKSCHNSSCEPSAAERRSKKSSRIAPMHTESLTTDFFDLCFFDAKGFQTDLQAWPLAAAEKMSNQKPAFLKMARASATFAEKSTRLLLFITSSAFFYKAVGFISSKDWYHFYIYCHNILLLNVFDYAKIVQGESNEACFNCRAAANLMQRDIFSPTSPSISVFFLRTHTFRQEKPPVKTYE